MEKEQDRRIVKDASQDRLPGRENLTPSDLVRGITDNLHRFGPAEQKQILRELQEFSGELDIQQQNISEIIGKDGAGLKRLSRENLHKLISIANKDPEKAKAVQAACETGDFSALDEALKKSLESTDDIIEISRVMAVDTGVPTKHRQILAQSLKKVDELLAGFLLRLKALEKATPVIAIKAAVQEFLAARREQQSLAEPVSFRKSVERNEPGTIHELPVDLEQLARKERIDQLQVKIEATRTSQSERRGRLFLISHDSLEYLKVKIELADLEIKQGELEQERKDLARFDESTIPAEFRSDKKNQAA